MTKTIFSRAGQFMHIAYCLALVQMLSGCGLFDAPAVSNERPGGGDVSIDTASSGGCESRLGGQPSEVVRVPLKKLRNDDRWVYWAAGSDRVVEEPSPEWVKSRNWDMRIKKIMPFVSTNGGETTLNIAGLRDNPGLAAVMPWGSDTRAILPSAATLSATANQADAPWSADRYEGIVFGEQSLLPDYQNPLVNAVGSGILSNYDPNTHDITLSGNIYILRNVDGDRFFAVRFCEYSKADNWIKFQWRRIE